MPGLITGATRTKPPRRSAPSRSGETAPPDLIHRAGRTHLTPRWCVAMMSIYDQIYDTAQHLKTARREDNWTGELQAQHMLDHMLDTLPRTEQPKDPHGTTAPST